MIEIARQLLRYRGLVATLTARELKARYRGSALGFFWSLVNPLLLFGVYSFVFGTVLRPRGLALIEPYSIFLIVGLFPWIWVSGSLLEGTVSLLNNSGLIRKAVFPVEILPTVAVLSNLAHFLLALPIVGVALGVGRGMGFEIGGPGVGLLPLVVALELIFVSGLALGLAALQVHFKDIRDVLANLLTLLFFLQPIIYSLDQIPPGKLTALIRLNPFTPFTASFQAVLFRGEPPELGLWLQMIALAAVSWLIGTAIFARLRDTLVEAV